MQNAFLVKPSLSSLAQGRFSVEAEPFVIPLNHFTDFRIKNRIFTEAVLPTQALTFDKKTSTMIYALVSNIQNLDS